LEELLKAVSDAIDFDSRQLKRVSIDVETKRDYERLTPREREVCAWLVKGLLNKDIAVKLGTTDATIKVHKARVMEKMHADSLQSLVKKYLEVRYLKVHPLTLLLAQIIVLIWPISFDATQALVSNLLKVTKLNLVSERA
jgi:DNA-binding CsgD family transcriptional regulator